MSKASASPHKRNRLTLALLSTLALPVAIPALAQDAGDATEAESGQA
jgi:hypothetical protein